MKCRIPQASDTGQPAKLPFSGETDGLKVETITGLAVVPEGADGTRDGRELPRTTGDATGEIKGGPADSINDGDCEMAVVGISVASPARLSGDWLGRTAGARLAMGKPLGTGFAVATEGADGTRDGRELPRTTGDATGEIKGGPADSINDGDCEMAVVGLSVASPTRLSGDLLGRTAGTRLATGDLSGCILSVGTKVGALISVGKDVGGVLGQGLAPGDKLGSGLVLRVADGT